VKESPKRELMKSLYDIGAIGFGEFTLKSGKRSPYYFDLRTLSSHPTVLREAGKVMAQMILDDVEKPEVLCGVPAAGLAIANAVSFETGIPVIYTRKEPILYRDLALDLSNRIKHREEDGGVSLDERLGMERAIAIVDSLSGLKTHGIARYVDGDFENGAKIGIVDDLITTAESKIEARDLVLLEARRREVTVSVSSVYVLLDREQGGREVLQEQDLKLWSVATVREAAKHLFEATILSSDEYESIVNYTIADRKAMGLQA
jgi:uridine monophosphate synthetase